MIRSGSVKICMYLEKGNNTRNMPRAEEYIAQNGSSAALAKSGFIMFPMLCVRNPPLPAIVAVTLSAIRRSGNISHNEYLSTMSDNFSFVVFLIFTARE